MGRFFPTTLIDFYEPRIHRAWLRKETADRKISFRSRFMIRLLIVLVLLQPLAPSYVRWWIAQQTPGAAVPSIWRIHLMSILGIVLIYAAYRTLQLFNKLCRVRIRLTDQFIQRFHGNSGPIIKWKHAEHAALEVTTQDGITWTVMAVYSNKQKHPMCFGIPEDQPIEPILEFLAEQGVPVSQVKHIAP